MLLFRALAGFALLAPALICRRSDIKSSRPTTAMMHAALWGLGAVFGYNAFGRLPLATAHALFFSRAFFVVLLTLTVLRERARPLQIADVILGFLGVLIIARPTEMAFSLATLSAILSSFLVAATYLTMKDMARDHSIFSIVVWGDLGSVICALPLAFLAWRTPSFFEGAVFALLAFVGLFGQSLYTRGVAIGDASLMSIVEYARLPFIIILGFWMFQEPIDILTATGAVIVVGTTAFITLQEARLRKRAAPIAPD
jgi:drug/metabolite transporter (DMT)-like permease